MLHNDMTSKFIVTYLATESFTPETTWQKAVRKFLEFFIPKANPDFDELYDSVRKWWVEIDEKSAPCREIGFDVNNNPIVIGPFGENHGLWTDSNVTFKGRGKNKMSQVTHKFRLDLFDFKSQKAK